MIKYFDGLQLCGADSTGGCNTRINKFTISILRLSWGKCC